MPEQHNIFRSSGGSPLSRLFLSIKFKALIKIFDKNVLRGSQKQAQLRSFLFPSRPFLQPGYFSHASETPGLGAEIATAQFQGEFPGKKTLENGEIALGVVKNGKVEKPDYQVDGISGGTITSVGVDAMLKTCLNSYKNFLTNNNEEK